MPSLRSKKMTLPISAVSLFSGPWPLLLWRLKPWEPFFATPTRAHKSAIKLRSAFACFRSFLCLTLTYCIALLLSSCCVVCNWEQGFQWQNEDITFSAPYALWEEIPRVAYEFKCPFAFEDMQFHLAPWQVIRGTSPEQHHNSQSKVHFWANLSILNWIQDNYHLIAFAFDMG